MIETPHRVPPAHLPWFITEPGQTDWLMIFTGIFLLCFVALVAVLMLRLLYLPLTMVPQEQKAQYEVVGTLCLLAMFAPGNFLWIAALLVAMMDIPDPTRAFNRMADAMRRVSENGHVEKSTDLNVASPKTQDPPELSRQQANVQ